MSESKHSPYLCHIFVCLNDRQGVRKSCGDGEAAEIRQQLKTVCKEKGWHDTKVRVSQTGCMGLCEHGPNVVIYPQKIWFSGATLQDTDRIIAEVEKIIRNSD